MIRYLLAVLLAQAIICQNIDIKPSCSTPYQLSYIPIAVGETEVLNLDTFINGFNLKLELNDAPDYVTMSNKFTKKATRDEPQPGLRNYHLQPMDNSWGSDFVTLSEVNYTTTVRWGKLQAREAIPEIQGTVVINTTDNLVCFDAVLFRDQFLVMVDCAIRTGSPDTGYDFQNQFLYINITEQKLLPWNISNEMYVPFRHIWHRKFYKYTENGYHYLMRVYFADGVDQENRNNTYFEIMSANDPRKPFILKVVDRSFLDLDRFALMDFKVYLGDIYLLDFHQGLLRFDITGSQQLLITGRYVTDSGFTKFGVFSNNLDNEFLLVLANSHAVYEVDWTNQIQPVILTKYSIMSNSFVNSLAVNHNYVVVQA
jgi:hypothetical protein